MRRPIAGRLLPVALVVLAAAVPASAQDPADEPARAVTTSVTADLLSHYVWRGVRLSDGVVLQPSAGVETHGFGVNVWWNFAASSSSPAPGG
jgi:hypothetical protein